ncbi:MAG: T9SS type A sorting domain-containing protein [Crocinitomicaceae bacterium]
MPENLSVSKKEMVSNLSVYPNPVVDILTINFESTEPVNVTITDMNGSIVYILKQHNLQLKLICQCYQVACILLKLEMKQKRFLNNK